jgi:hypothetical protein
VNGKTSARGWGKRTRWNLSIDFGDILQANNISMIVLRCGRLTSFFNNFSSDPTVPPLLSGGGKRPEVKTFGGVYLGHWAYFRQENPQLISIVGTRKNLIFKRQRTIDPYRGE